MKVNKPEARELFEFLNPFLKLSDRRSLDEEILRNAVAEGDKVMEIALKEDQTGITLIFDSLEREMHVEVMEKTEAMIFDLNLKEVNVCTIITDSTSEYAAAR
ncbi:hypothetical protein GLOIN_2v473602 [Rhizophagus clarus]|uniref:DUF659 domain-containing protein n=1 Tax=Rhizophagus clarus TaxID=94130 RepID=A0A8H3QXW1_9GLOM|nr:hypothetical protein GLOIN_2v473602 [Rhizophagus clarus]